jgi:hypothetical protein
MNVLLALDAATGIFNNCSPRVNYCELDLQLPLQTDYFEMSFYNEAMQRQSLPRSRMKLIDAFQRLFVQPSELQKAYESEILCCWDMLYLVHGELALHFRLSSSSCC